MTSPIGVVAGSNPFQFTYDTSDPTSLAQAMSLTAGQEVFSRDLLNSSAVAQGSGVMRPTYFTGRKSAASTGVRILSGATAAAATPTLCRIGLWLAAADGSCSALVASTPNDTTLFAAANTEYVKNWSTPYNMIAGQRYALGVLVLSAAAMPSFGGTGSPIFFAESAKSPVMSSNVTGLADLPATILAAAAGNGNGRIYGVIV